MTDSADEGRSGPTFWFSFVFEEMHKFSNFAALARFRFAALLLLLKWPLWLAALAFLAYAVATHDHRQSWVGWGLGGVALVLVYSVFQAVMAGRCRCPLCMGQPLVRTGAARRRTVKTFLGSYRLRVVMTMLFRGFFRCPYCGEPVEMTVRERRR